MTVVDGAFDQPLALEEHATALLAGGIAGMGYQCGQVWGAALAAGAQAYRVYGPGLTAEAAAVRASQRLVDVFRKRYKSLNCSDVIHFDYKNPKAAQVLGFLLKGGPARCFGMTASYSRAAFKEIEAAYTDSSPALESPVSCAALLAQRMGASEVQQVIASGLAGGIGLSGGACGALGTAVWLRSMMSSGQEFSYNNEIVSSLVERFLESAEDFECEKIVGRRFADVEDHARYVQEGGCKKIIEALANSFPFSRS